MNKDINQLKVAIAVEELTQLGGAERVLDAFLEIFPKATIFTLVWDKVKTHHAYDKFNIVTSFIQRAPLGIKNYKWYLPLMPLAVESLDLKGYDLILSSSSAMIKGIKTTKDQTHICYCHTPTRYLWSDRETYLKTAPIPTFIKPIMPLVTWFLRRWDLKASKRPDYYIANSKNIRDKIKKYYKIETDVIYPPVEADKFKISQTLGDYFLVASRLEPYKKADLVIEAFMEIDAKLKIVGSGSKKEDWQALAGPNVEFTGRISDQELAETYSKALAFIFPQEEDFGIVALEAMASGRPVIAYRKAGALESVVEGKTGEFFYPQTPDALRDVIKKFDPKKYNSEEIRAHAKTFDVSVFKEQIVEYIKERIK